MFLALPPPQTQGPTSQPFPLRPCSLNLGYPPWSPRILSPAYSMDRKIPGFHSHLWEERGDVGRLYGSQGGPVHSPPMSLSVPSPTEPCISRRRPKAAIPDPTMLPPQTSGASVERNLEGHHPSNNWAPPQSLSPRILSSVARESPQQGVHKEGCPGPIISVWGVAPLASMEKRWVGIGRFQIQGLLGKGRGREKPGPSPGGAGDVSPVPWGT